MTTRAQRPPLEIVDVVVSDHVRFGRLFDRILELQGSADTRAKRDVIDTLTPRLISHAGAETQVLYPAVRLAAEDGGRQYEEAVEETIDVARSLADVRRTDPTSAEWDRLTTRLVQTTRDHIAHEEDRLLPLLASSWSTRKRQGLGVAFRAAQAVGPLRPHPRMPHRVPAVYVAGSVMGVVDKVVFGPRLLARAAARRRAAA